LEYVAKRNRKMEMQYRKKQGKIDWNTYSSKKK
jgi:hypothetical protein